MSVLRTALRTVFGRAINTPPVATKTAQKAMSSAATLQGSPIPPHLRPTATGHRILADVTPRPPYGEEHPVYPLVRVQNPDNTVADYMLLRYTGTSKIGADAILREGPTYRLFTTPSFKYASSRTEAGGKVLSLGIGLPEFVKIANGYGYRAEPYTVDEIRNSPEALKNIQITRDRKGNILGFEPNDSSEDYRDFQSMYLPLRHLITVSSTVLDVKDPGDRNGTGLDYALIKHDEAYFKFKKDNSRVYQFFCRNFPKLVARMSRPEFDFEPPRPTPPEVEA